MDGVDQSDIQVRFTLNDGKDSASPATSESFQVDNEGPTDTIVSASYDSSTDTVTITVNEPPNQSPVADAGLDQTVTDSDENGTETFFMAYYMKKMVYSLIHRRLLHFLCGKSKPSLASLIRSGRTTF